MITCQGYAQKKPRGYYLGEKRDPGEMFYFQGTPPPSSRKMTFLRLNLEGLLLVLIGSRSSGYMLGTIDGIILPIPNDGPIPGHLLPQVLSNQTPADIPTNAPEDPMMVSSFHYGWLWLWVQSGPYLFPSATELTIYMEKSGKKARKSPGPLAFHKMGPSYDIM